MVIFYSHVKKKDSIGKNIYSWFPYVQLIKYFTKVADISDIDLAASPNIKSKGLDIRIRNAFEHYFNYAPEIKLYLHPYAILQKHFILLVLKSLGLSIDGAGDGISVLIADCQREKFQDIESYPFDNSMVILCSCDRKTWFS